MANPTMEERLGRFRLFRDFSPGDCAQVASFVKEEMHSRRHVLYRQGDQPEFFYLVEKGSVEQVGAGPKGKVALRRRADAFDYLGHRSLLNDTLHQTTATAREDISLLAIPAASFKALLAAFPRLRERLQRIDEVVNRLLATPLFSCFSIEQLHHVADLVQVVDYPAQQRIFRQGEMSDALYVINTGQVKESVTGAGPPGQSWPQYLTAGSFFGGYGLLQGAPRRATAEAVTDVSLFRLPVDAFRWLQDLQPEFGKNLARPDIVARLRQIDLCSRLGADELKHLAGYVGLAHYPAGEILYRQGEMDPTLYILTDGEAVVRTRDEQGKRRPSGYLMPGDAVGETSLFLQDPRDATVESVVDSAWLYLTRQDLDQFVAQHPQVRDRWVLKEEVKTRRELKRFPWMDPDEQFVIRERRHGYFLAVRIVLPGLLLLGALLAFFLPVSDLLAIVLLGIALAWILWSVTDWANDYYIVTTKRVAHREKVFMIRETRDETPLDKIQNMNIVRGLYGNLFGFGALIIDTAAAAGVSRVTFDHLADPDQVQARIFELMSRAKAGERSATRQAIRDKLEASVGQSIHPVVPRPAVPVADVPELTPPEPGSGQQVFQIVTDLARDIFWIEKREQNQITWRKHWIRLLRKTWMPVLAIVLLGLALFIVLSQIQAPWSMVAVLSVLLFGALGWFWWGWVNWGNDLYIVTQDRIIDIEELPLGFSSQRTETTFDRIQNVSFNIPNPLATILNYGTVVVFTAGAVGQLDFEWVRDPKGVQAEIFRRLAAYEAAQRQQQREQRWADLPEWFATYEEMNYI